MKTITIENVSGEDKTYSGQTILDTETYTLQAGEVTNFSKSESLLADVGSGLVVIGNGSNSYSSTEGWAWLNDSLSEVHVTQKSDSQGEKIAAHVSSKPILEGKSFYATWTGAGDNVSGDANDGEIGGGEMMVFDFTGVETEITKTSKFHSDHGDVYVHDGYVKWQGGHIGDYLTVRICSDASLLQELANLDLVVNDTWISYSPSGPGTGTHGFAATPVLVPRTYSQDGDWDYTTEGGLVPNFSGTGSFKMSTDEQVVHSFINKMPIIGDSDNYLKLYSEESTLLPSGFSLNITVYCPDGGDSLEASAIMYLYREKTAHTP